MLDAIARIAEPLALGFSTGTWCVMYCAPVLLPFLCGRENVTHKKNLGLVGLFLGGRLATYAAVGLVLGAAGLLVSEFFDPAFARRLSSVAYVFCGAVMLLSGFAPRLLRRLTCGEKTVGSQDSGGLRPCLKVRAFSFVTGDRMTALLAGLCVGLHICPPFWTAAARSASSGSPLSGALYFALFYAGTLPFFLPLLGIPFFSPKVPSFRRVARMTQVLVGGYFFLIAGLVAFLFGA
jgi:sulfite exporter TauE/SafE